METLTSQVKQKAGLTDEQAKQAVSAMTEFLKQKFPQFLHSELDKIIEGGEFGDNLRSKLEGLKDKLEDAAKQFGTKAESFAGEVKEKMNEMFNQKKSD